MLKGFLEPQGWYQSLMGGSSASSSGPAKETIAFLSMQGAIDSKQWTKLAPALEKIRKDDTVKCVVVRVDSPGGTIDASETILQELKALDKKVVVSFGNVAASGGYYVASLADQIFASKNTIVSGQCKYYLFFLRFPRPTSSLLFLLIDWIHWCFWIAIGLVGDSRTVWSEIWPCYYLRLCHVQCTFHAVFCTNSSSSCQCH